MSPETPGRKPGGNATIAELYAALGAGALPGRLPERPAGFKRITDGLGRVRYRKRVRINGRKVAVTRRGA